LKGADVKTTLQKALTPVQHFCPGRVVTDIIEQLLDEAKETRHNRADDEILIECKVCGHFDGHEPECPIPAIERFMESSIVPAASHRCHKIEGATNDKGKKSVVAWRRCTQLKGHKGRCTMGPWGIS
jgi:hypothetical protein